MLPEAAVPNLFGTRDQSVGDNFSMDRTGGWFGDDSSIYIHCALYFYYYYISSTSDHQALHSGGWGPLT